MNFLIKNEKNILYSFLFIIIVLGFYLCFIGGYGSDEDTLPMIHAFEAKLGDGRFVSSRFTGNPVAELGIGFLSYFLGSWAANSVTYILLLLGIIFFYLSFEKKKTTKNIYFFLFLCLTNPIIFFDNLEPVDYSWALFFYSLGIFLFNKKIFELSVLFFAISIGVRINYVLFVLITILFYQFEDKVSLYRRLGLFFSAFVIGGLFYLPVWFDNSFNLSWLTAARPTDQGIYGLFARFTYKLYVSVGYISTFLLFYIFLKERSNLLKIHNFKVLSLLGMSNLLIFLWIPAEFSYVQLFLVILFFIFYVLDNSKFFYILCLCNLISWIVFINPLKITHAEKDICLPKNAISADIKFSIESGFYYKFLKSRKKIQCWVYGQSERDIKILQGKALK